jgi:hypothetical protein
MLMSYYHELFLAKRVLINDVLKCHNKLREEYVCLSLLFLLLLFIFVLLLSEDVTNFNIGCPLYK